MEAIQKVAKLLQELPQLRQMAEQAEAQRKAEALQARRDAIARYRDAAALKEAADEKLAKAEAKMQALRDKLLAEQETLSRVHAEVTLVRNRFSSASRELMHLHAEGDVERARYKLMLLRQQCAARIDGLESRRFEVGASGLFKYERPEIRAKLTEAQAQLQKIEAAEQEIGGLHLTEELDPADLAERVAAILHRVAPPPPKPAKTEAEA